MLSRLVTLSVLALGVLLLAGCGPAKLNETKTLNLNGEFPARAIDLPAQSKPQTIYIEFTSNGGEVSVYVFKEEDAKGDDMVSARATKAIAKVTDSKGDNFSVEIPENTATRVVVRGGGRTADVNLKITNQKK